MQRSVAGMLKWGFVYFLLAVASGVMGVTDQHVATAVLAQLFFFANVVLFVVFTLLGAMSPEPAELPPGESPLD